MKHSKKMTLTAMLLSSVFLTGCFFQDVPSSDNTGEVSRPAATKTYSSDEIKKLEKDLPEDQKVGTDAFTAPPKETIEYDEKTFNKEENDKNIQAMKDNPLGMDIDKIVIPDNVKESFPSESFDVHEGVRVGLSLYESIVHEEGLYEARDISQDWRKFYEPWSEDLHPKFKEDLKKLVDAGTVNDNHVLMVTDGKGDIFRYEKGELIRPAMAPLHSYSEPVLDVRYIEAYDVDYIEIRGNKLVSFKATNGKMFHVDVQYVIGVTNLHDNEWVVTTLESLATDVEVQ